MKLKEFTKSHERTWRPMIRFNKKGVFTINKCAVDKLGISPGKDLLQFFANEDNEAEWFISVSSTTGFMFKKYDYGGSCSQFLMNNTSLMREMSRKMKIPFGSNSFIVGGKIEIEGKIFYPLFLNKNI